MKAGPSPRVRGKLIVSAVPGDRERSIPACAGEAAPPGAIAARARVHPRVCGGSAGQPQGGRPN